jgi:V/A-type H+/Na+-transporting ATPase subunit K
MKNIVSISRKTFVAVTGVLGFLLFAGTPLFASGTAAGAAAASGSYWAYIAAALAFGFGALGAGYAISHVGAAAMGAMGEKPEVGNQALLFIAMAEGIVVFGFVIAFLILGKV